MTVQGWWSKRRVLVTGASSGIGAALAVELAKAGAVVGLCARRTSMLDAVVAECRRWTPASQAWTVDLADIDALDGFVGRVEDALGGIDVLVNNAGLSLGGEASSLAWEDVEYLMRLDYLSPVRLSRAALPAMLRRGAGHVMVVSSMAARVATPGEAAYAAAKAALSAYFEALAGELMGTGISFHLVYPGLIDLTPGVDGPDSLADTADGGLRVPAPVLARAMMDQVSSGVLELYMPRMMRDFAANRAKDVGASVKFMGGLYRAGALS